MRDLSIATPRTLALLVALICLLGYGAHSGLLNSKQSTAPTDQLPQTDVTTAEENGEVIVEYSVSDGAPHGAYAVEVTATDRTGETDHIRTAVDPGETNRIRESAFNLSAVESVEARLVATNDTDAAQPDTTLDTATYIREGATHSVEGAALHADLHIDEPLQPGDALTVDAQNFIESKHPVDSYRWDFEGTTIHNQTATHAFSEAGNYTVTLTVTDVEGNVAATEATVAVQPEVELTATQHHIVQQPNTTFSLSVDAVTTTAPTNAEYSWDLDDGTTKTGNSITHSYAATGNYSITLTATTDGQRAHAQIPVVIRGNLSTIRAPARASVGEPVQITRAHEYGSLGVTWTLDNDTTIQDERTLTRSYDAAGESTIDLAVTNVLGDTFTETHTLSVVPTPQAQTARGDRDVLRGESVTFDGQNSTAGADLNLTQYRWRISDGTTATEETLNHTFTENGTYTVELTVTDELNATNTTAVTVNVHDPTDVTANITLETDSDTDVITPADSLTFTAAQSESAVNITEYTWDFETVTTTGRTVTHSYTEAGEHNVTLTIRDELGRTATTTTTVTVTEPAEPRAAFTMSANPATPGEFITFDANASQVGDGVSLTAYEWNVADRVQRTGKRMQYYFDEEGTYPIELTVTDELGRTATVEQNVTVSTPPEAVIEANTTTEFRDIPLHFDARNSTGTIESYQWRLGNEPATGNETTHTFSEPNTYDITLLVEDDVGQTDTASTTVTIEEPAPPVAVIDGPTRGLLDDDLAFTANESYSPYGDIVSYNWTITNETTNWSDAGETLTHNHTTVETYTVELTVTDSFNNTATTTQDVKIVPEPEVTATDSMTVEVGTSYQFSADVNAVNDNLTYEWNFDDGQTAENLTTMHAYNSTGNYTATITVTNEYGESDTASIDVEVVTVPSVDVGGNMETTVGTAAQFNATVDANSNNLTYEWNFGDGNTSAETAPTHTYTAQDTYTVSLQVTNEYGMSDTDSLSITVTDPLFRLTSNAYDNMYDGDQACREEFGNAYRMATWSEVRNSFYDKPMETRKAFDETPDSGGRTVGRVWRGGSQWYSGNRAYWVSHEPDKWVDNSNALIHAGTGSGRTHRFWVGSWYSDYRVTCTDN